MDENTWIGVGRLVRDPEVVPAGRKGPPHILFTVASNQVVARASGPKANYVPCAYWGEDALELAAQMAQGNEVAVVGSIYTDMIDKGNGRHEFFWEIRVEELQLGREALKNLAPRAPQTQQMKAVNRLHREFR